MAKGDHKRVENEINTQSQLGQDRMENIGTSLYGANTGFQNNFNTASTMTPESYNDIMAMYKGLYDNPFGPGGSGGGGGGIGTGAGSAYDIYSGLANYGGGYGWDPEWRGGVSKALSGFGNFADTGGFSEQDIQDIRARSIAPTRAVYQQGMDQIQRQRAIQPFSPNANSAIARMARNSAIDIGDINTNANAAIAQMRQQGKLAGLQGLSGTGLGAQGASTNIDQLNAQMKLAGLSGMSSIDAANAAASASRANAELGARLEAAGGARLLFGTTPGMLQTSGDQLLQSNRNLLGFGQLGNDFGVDMINARLNNAQVPGNYQTALGNIGSTLKLAQSAVSPYQWATGGGIGKSGDNSGKGSYPAVYGRTGNPYGYGMYGYA